MDSREWMVVNPCDRDCEFKKKNSECAVKYCDAYIMYQERIAAQKKLLEYLRSNCVEIQTGYPEMNRVESFSLVFYRDALESMLKQLEEQNDFLF